MTIPIANAIFGKKLEIKNFLKVQKKQQISDLIFKKVDKNISQLLN